MSKITIGMPVYNGAAFIERAIASVEAQTCTDFTVLVADNGSTDGSWEILQAWAARDDRVTLHRHEENIGIMGNFHYVLDHAETAYFMWHACDDWLSPNCLEALGALLDASPHCALACADASRVMIDGSPKSRNPERPFPDLAGQSRRRRIMTLLRRPEAVWTYGLFRIERLRGVQKDSVDFGHVWSSDRLMLLPLILDDAISGAPEAHFYSRVTVSSSQRYSPPTLWLRLGFIARYVAFSMAIYRNSGLSLPDKTIVFPWLLMHTNRTCRSGFYKYNIKQTFKRLTGR